MSETRYEAPGTIVLSQIARTIASYRRAILIALAVIAAALVLGGLALAVFGPATQRTTLRFRLLFTGADAGVLPNGSRFNASEIVATPVLARVHEEHGLSTYLTLEELRAAVFVMEANDQVARLEKEYEAKLADPKLAPQERDRVAAERDAKRAALGHAHYAITLLTPDRMKSMPSSLREKVLSDILTTWATGSIRDKGVLLYDTAVPSRNLFDAAALQSHDYLIALDLIRTRIDSVIRNIDRLAAVPGANAVRVGPERMSLADARLRLGELVDVRLGPLYGMVVNNRLSRSNAELRDFLQMRLAFTELQIRDAERRVESLRAAMRDYGSRGAAPATGEQQRDVVQQVDGNLIESLARLSGEASDVEYRQQMTDQIRTASLQLLPLRAQSEFYRMLVDRVSGAGSEPRAATAQEAAEMERSTAATLQAATLITDRVREAYDVLSRGLSPSAALYQVTDPPLHARETPFGMRKVAVASFFLLLLSVPFVLAACLLHDRYARTRRDERTTATSGLEPVS